MSRSVIGPRSDSQQNVFNVLYLGRAPMPNFSAGEGILQTCLFDMYSKFKTKKRTKKLSSAKIVLNNRGLSLVNWTNDEEFYALSNIVLCKAVIFTGSKTKVNRTKYYKFAFESLADIGRGSTITTAMAKSFKYLLKAKKHEPLMVCILRRDLGPKVLEVHAFVCNSNDQAMGLSYSIEMARSVGQSEGWRRSNDIDSDLFASAPHRKVEISFPQDQGNSNEDDLPKIIEKLHKLGGGRGSVVNPVIKTSNVNLINDNFFFPPSQTEASSRGQQVKSSVAHRGNDLQSRVFQLSQGDVMGAPTKLGHARSSSFDQLKHLSIFQEDMDFRPSQKSKESVSKGRQPVQRARSMKNNSDNVHEGALVSSDPSGGADKPNRPVAMVQPRKISGIKVFPFGHDRTGLIPDKDKLRKRKIAEESKSQSQVQSLDHSSLYSQVNKGQKNQFVIKSSTEDQLNKMAQEVSMQGRK